MQLEMNREGGIMDKRYLDGPKGDTFKKRLFDDVYVNEVLDFLDGSDMQQEKENFIELLSRVDGMYKLIQAQEKSIHDLENEIERLNEPKTKRLLNEIINEAKEEYSVLKNKYIDLKETIVERCKFLVDTFKASGQFAFYKAFEGISKVLKDLINDLKSRHIHSRNKIDKQIARLGSIRNELNKAKGHFKNIRRLIMGKDVQPINESKSAPLILASALNHFEKSKRTNERFLYIDDKCINKLDLLEKSFREKSQEKKKSLDDRIAQASEIRKMSNEKTNEQVAQHGR